MGMTLCVARSVIDTMLSEAVHTLPEEACGLLLGTSDRIETAIPTRNVHVSPRTHFEIDPAALIAAHRAAREGGPGLAGYWHSHPVGDAVPSAADRAMAAGDGKVWAIVAGQAIAFWGDSPAGFEPLSYIACAR